MGAEQAGGLEDLLMGNVTEGSEETSEQLAARISAAQARLAAVKKDEKKATGDDRHLAKVVKYLSPSLLSFVSWMINQEIPSFTILALLSLSCRPASEFMEKKIELGDYAVPEFLTEVSNKAIQRKIADWGTLVIAADHQSTTVYLGSLRLDSTKISRFEKGVRLIIETYWLRATTEFDATALDKVARGVVDLCCIRKV